MRPLPLGCAAFAIAMSGCFSTEHVGRPPSPADVARINDDVDFGTSIAVKYVSPLAAPPGHLTFKSIAAADERTLTLNLKTGAQMSLPLDVVTGVSVRHAGRVRGGALGAAIGGGAMFGLVGFAYLLVAAGSHCDLDCQTLFAQATVIGAVAGAITGALIGTSRRYDFDGAPGPTGP